MKDIVDALPPGAYKLDCRPYGGIKLLKVDPAYLTPEERLAICKGIDTFHVNDEFELRETDGRYSIHPRVSK